LNRLAPALAALAIVLLASGCSGLRASRARARVPRVVVVTIDTLHVGRTGPYNFEVSTTPVLDRLADEGVRFDYAYTHTPITLPSHAALFAGSSPASIGVMANGERVPESANMLAERLREAGYRTGAFISLGVLRPTFGLNQGFQDFHDPFIEGPPRWYRRSHEMVGPVNAWLDEHGDEPFFLWVHLSDPHEPYVTPDAPPDSELWLDDELIGSYSLASAEEHLVDIEIPSGAHRLRWVSLWQPRDDDRPESGVELLVMSRVSLKPFTDDELPRAYTLLQPALEVELENDEPHAARLELLFAGRLSRPPPSFVLPNYDENVARTDRYLGELVDKLESIGARDETLIVIVSDHGEGLFGHDILGHASHVYEDQLRILWMMHGAGLPEGYVIENRPGLMKDVAPTILGVLGLSRWGMDGRSWVRCWESDRCPESDPFWTYGLSHETRGLTGMASYRWPYKWMWRRGFERIAFDVARDPWEQVNLLDDAGPHNPEPLKESAEAFRAERRRLSKALRESEGRSEDDATERLLESLGYITSDATEDPEREDDPER